MKLFIAVMFVLVLSFVGQTTEASQNMLLDIYFPYLHGVDTIVVGGSSVPEHTLLPEHRRTAEEDRNPPDPIFLVVQDIFSKMPWMSVKMARDVSFKDMEQPNVMYFNYAISARQKTLDGKTFKLGSMTLQLEKWDSRTGRKSAIPIIPVTYPFFIPDSEQAFRKETDEAVSSLAAWLPGYLEYANPDKAIHDKPYGINPKYNEYVNFPFDEKPSVKCPPSTPGVFRPVQCGPGTK